MKYIIYGKNIGINKLYTQRQFCQKIPEKIRISAKDCRKTQISPKDCRNNESFIKGLQKIANFVQRSREKNLIFVRGSRKKIFFVRLSGKKMQFGQKIAKENTKFPKGWRLRNEKLIAKAKNLATT